MIGFRKIIFIEIKILYVSIIALNTLLEEISQN